MTTLSNLLNEWNSDTLKKYVLLLDGNSKLTRKGDRIDYICAKLLHKPTLNAIWQQLDPIAQRAVSTAYYSEGKFDAQTPLHSSLATHSPHASGRQAL